MIVATLFWDTAYNSKRDYTIYDFPKREEEKTKTSQEKNDIS
jgi:hypothetical protein